LFKKTEIRNAGDMWENEMKKKEETHPKAARMGRVPRGEERGKERSTIDAKGPGGTCTRGGFRVTMKGRSQQRTFGLTSS